MKLHVYTYMLPFIISNIRTIHGRYYIMTKIKETSYFNNVSIKKNFIKNNIHVYSVFHRSIHHIYKCTIFKSFEVADSQSDNYGIYNYTH